MSKSTPHHGEPEQIDETTASGETESGETEDESDAPELEDLVREELRIDGICGVY